jgi:hypothetical protein
MDIFCLNLDLTSIHRDISPNKASQLFLGALIGFENMTICSSVWNDDSKDSLDFFDERQKNAVDEIPG